VRWPRGPRAELRQAEEVGGPSCPCHSRARGGALQEGRSSTSPCGRASLRGCPAVGVLPSERVAAGANTSGVPGPGPMIGSRASERRTSTRGSATVTEPPEDAVQWSWPPYAPVEPVDESFDTDEWAPPSVVRHPRWRIGRWTVGYRRAAGSSRRSALARLRRVRPGAVAGLRRSVARGAATVWATRRRVRPGHGDPVPPADVPAGGPRGVSWRPCRSSSWPWSG
jgi:hypothetical protein